MVEGQIVNRGITDEKIIDVLRRVPRHEFIPPEFSQHSYEDFPVTIGCGQTISQPYIVAVMTQALELKVTDDVLEVGTGSGYQTAILAELCREVYTIERIEELARTAKTVLERLNYRNVHYQIADGSLGWQENILFDAILITAAAPLVPSYFLNELKENGRLVVPLGNKYEQTLCRFRKTQNGVIKQEICPCVFVPLIGKYGWKY